jgi:hypothetical protein
VAARSHPDIDNRTIGVASGCRRDEENRSVKFRAHFPQSPDATAVLLLAT